MTKSFLTAYVTSAQLLLAVHLRKDCEGEQAQPQGASYCESPGNHVHGRPGIVSPFCYESDCFPFSKRVKATAS